MSRLLAYWLLLFVSSQTGSAEWHVVAPRVATPGSVITTYVRSDGTATDLEVSLFRGRRPVSSGIGREVARRSPAGGVRVYVSVLGIPGTAEWTEVVLRVTGHEDDAPRTRTYSIPVVPREFVSEEIPLSTAMTDLRRSDEEIIVAQAEALWEMLLTRNPDAVITGGETSLPLEKIHFTSFFGDRRVYRYSDGSAAESIHNGVDLRGPVGTPVVACAGGRVTLALDRVITGKSVAVEHLPGVYSLYYHLDRIDVEPGAVVDAGDVLGLVGATGLVTGPHLHWEVRAVGVAVDPEMFVSRAGVYCLVDKAQAIMHLTP